MRLSISPAIAVEHHLALADLVAVGFRGVNDAGVEVHIRSRPPRVSYVVRYEAAVAGLSPEIRATWLARHPGATTVPVARVFPRRAAADALAAEQGGSVERRIDDRLGERMSGYAYYEFPDRARVAKTTEYLVTLRLPARLEALAYPITLQYHRGEAAMRTAPEIELHHWREEVVHLVAHEAYHVKEFRLGMRESEVAAERWALRTVERFRRDHGVPATRVRVEPRSPAVAERGELPDG